MSIQIEADLLSREDVRQSIAERAYLISEKQGFAPGRELDHWLTAEAEVLSQFTATTGGQAPATATATTAPKLAATKSTAKTAVKPTAAQPAAAAKPAAAKATASQPAASKTSAAKPTPRSRSTKKSD